MIDYHLLEELLNIEFKKILILIKPSIKYIN